MAKRLYKQTFIGRPTVEEVHEAVGGRGGLILRIDQSDAAIAAYFEADEDAGAVAAKKRDENIQEVSLKDITDI